MSEFYKLVEIMKKLRAPDGCPWDREQSLETLKKTLIEECYEVLDVMEEEKHEELKGELGDLLLQVVFQAEIMDEKKYFNIDDVCSEITEKLIRRHPHIFGDVEVKDSSEVLKNWEEIKKTEKTHQDRVSLLDGIPKTMPPLEKTYKILNKVKKLEVVPNGLKESQKALNENFEYLNKISELDKDELKKSYGDFLFSLVNFGRVNGIEPYEELRKANIRFEEEFRKNENMYINKNKKGD